MSDSNPSKSPVEVTQGNTDIDLDAMINAAESLTSDIVSKASEKTKKKKNKKKKKKAKKATASTQNDLEIATEGKGKNLDSIMIGIEEYLHDDTEGVVSVNIKNDEKELGNINESTVIESKDIEENDAQSLEAKLSGTKVSASIDQLAEQSDELPVGDETTMISEISKEETKPELKEDTLSTLEQTTGQHDKHVNETQNSNRKNNDESVEPKVKTEKTETDLPPMTDEDAVSNIKSESVKNDEAIEEIAPAARDFNPSSSETKVIERTKESISNEPAEDIKETKMGVKQEPETGTYSKSDIHMKSEETSTLTEQHSAIEESTPEATERVLPEEHQEVEIVDHESKSSNHETSIPEEHSPSNGNEALEASLKEESKSFTENFENSKAAVASGENDQVMATSGVGLTESQSQSQQSSDVEMDETKSVENSEVSSIKERSGKETSFQIKSSTLESDNVKDGSSKIKATEEGEIEEKKTVVPELEDALKDETSEIEPTEAEELKEKEAVVPGVEDAVKAEHSQVETTEAEGANENESVVSEMKDVVKDEITQKEQAEVIEANTENAIEHQAPAEIEVDDSIESESEEPADKVVSHSIESKPEDSISKDNDTVEPKSGDSISKEANDITESKPKDSISKDHETLPQEEKEEKKEIEEEGNDEGMEGLSLPDGEDDEIPLSTHVEQEKTTSSLDDLFAETEALLNDLNFVDDSELAQLLNMGNGKDAKGAKGAKKGNTVKEEDVVKSSDIVKMNEKEPVYLYTSLAGGGFHMVPRTNRLATILQANRIEFTYRDLGTDDEARKVWKTFGHGRMLPAVVRGRDTIVGNWEEMEEFNEEYRTRQAIYEAL